MELEIANAGTFSNATGQRNLEDLTGCKKPRKAKALMLGAGFLTAGLSTITLKKKYDKAMKEYKGCLETYKNKVQSSKDATSLAELNLAVEKQKTADAKEAKEEKAIVSANESSSGKTMDASTSTDKFLGMPKTTGIIVTSFVGGLVLIGLGFLVYKKIAA